MKDEKAKNNLAPKLWISMRVSAFEKQHLSELAKVAGLSRTAYLRRRFFGGKPIIAHTDLCTIRELRRLGGLLKHNFESIRNADTSTVALKEALVGVLKNQEAVLKHVYAVIDRIGKSS